MAAAILDPLSRLAIQYGTDKWGQHLYTPIYHRLFASLRDQPIRMLEIGVGWPQISFLGGASLRMWRDYFPLAQLVGLDVQPKRLPDLGPRVTLVQGSQADPDLLRRVWAEHGPFDIVIDDGSHRVDHVLASFETLYPLMQDGGLYAVEDVQTAFWPEFGGSPGAEGSIVTRLHETVLAMHAPEARAAGQAAPFDRHGADTAAIHAYRNLIVFERGRNDYPSNRAFPMEHPAVRRCVQALDAERARAPSPGEVLTRLSMLEVAGLGEEALAEARAGLQAHPQSVALACVLQHLTYRMGHVEESRDLLQQLLRVWPDEPLLNALQTHFRERHPAPDASGHPETLQTPA